MSETSLLLLEEGREIQSMEQKQSRAGGWSSSLYIIGVEVAERFAYYGIAGNLMTYLTNVLHESTVSAAKNVNVWAGVTTMLPLLGAFIADSYLGRYRTILFSSLIYILGLAILALTVAFAPFKFKEPLFFISLYLVAIGEGGHKPCIQAFGADQFNDTSEEERRAKNSFFNWWYFGLCGGASAAILIVYYVQDNVGWAIGYGLPAVVMVFALVLFLLGRRLYRQQAPSGSALTLVAQVLVAAVRKSRLPLTMDNNHWEGEDRSVHVQTEVEFGSRPLAQTKQFRFLDKASIIDEKDASQKIKNKWRLCSSTQVEEVKLLIRLVPIWLSCLIYAVVLAQPSTFFTKQSSTTERKIRSFVIPAASLQVAIGLASVVTVPIYDRVIVRVTRRITGTSSGLTMLQRIGVGMFLSVISMVTAALVETRRLRIARENGFLDLPTATLPMSVWWMLPQYVILGVSDVFTMVGLQEFFYDQMPDGLRSLGAAAYLSIFGVGNFLSSGIIAIVEEVSSGWLLDNLNRARLDYYYWLLAGLSTLWFGLFLVLAKLFIYKRIDDAPP